MIIEADPWMPKPRKPYRKRRRTVSPLRSRGRRKNAQDTASQTSSGLFDGFDSVSTEIPIHKYIHLVNFGDFFAHTCALNPEFIDLFLPSSELFQTVPTLPSWGFTVDDTTYDLTNLTHSDTHHFIRFQSAYTSFDDTYPIIFDSGASISISPYKSDFISLDTNYVPTTLQGITGTTVCQGKGTIRLKVITDSGYPRIIETTALYVPNATVRLLSVQTYCKEVGGGAKLTIDEKGCQFVFPQHLEGGTITFDLGSNGNLPRTSASRQWVKRHVQSASYSSEGVGFSVVNEANINLSRAQKALLAWHWRLGHINLPWIQYLLRRQVISSDVPNVTTATCKCQACQLGKQVRTSEGVNKKTLRPEKDGGLKQHSLQPGSTISTDQFVSSLKGRLPNTYGKEAESEKFTGGTVFIDEASEFIFVQNQVSLGAEETLRGKHRFEREAFRHGIRFKSYRCDNGVYRSKAFTDDLDRQHQAILHSGVGAHHHNGVAERCIRTISTLARTILLHSMIHWPEQTSLDLWPFAIDYAVYLWNRLPKEPSGLSPEEIFYSVKSNHDEIRNAKVWGCPTFVLDPTLQDGKKLPRWEPRSKIGQFLGKSAVHASSVSLIKNCETGKVSSQFHTVFDEHFTTISVNSTPDADDIPDEWKSLFITNREMVFDQDDLLPQPTPIVRFAPRPQSSDSTPPSLPEGAEGDISSTTDTNNDADSDILAGTPSPSASPAPSSSPPSDRPSPPVISPAPEPILRRSSRQPRPNQRYYNDTLINYFGEAYFSYLSDFNQLNPHDAFLINTDLSTGSGYMAQQYQLLHSQHFDETENLLHYQHPFAFSANANSEDTLNYNEAMSSPDREGFLKAMDIEIEQLESMNVWKMVPRSEALHRNRTILNSTWAFRRKRYPDGSVKKLKARLCARGDQQINGVDYFDTFSPVVQWSTIRLMLILSLLLDLKTMQVDYTLAFVHAPVPPETYYIEMPKGFEVDGMIYELKRNLYGLCDAPKNFYYHLKKGLEQRGLKASPHDHCLFISPNLIVLTYVDDCIIFSRKQEHIDNLVESLRKPKSKDMDSFLLEQEEDYAGFLGINISRSNGKIELLQTGLIDRIIQVLNLDKDNVQLRTEPASTTPLHKDENGPPRKETWNYASVIGMMLYLASNSRPDIAFAVNQAARFSHATKLSHEVAVKRIARYLKATRDRGLIMKPTNTLNLELFADADFAGLWNVEHADDPSCVKSRTGYIITLGEVPVTWSSKLQSEIATSTMHAEYIALSTGMRELVPVKNTLDYICDKFKIPRDPQTQIIKCWEDNEGALKLANSPPERVTPNSKHFAIKYHWFREQLDNLHVSIRHVTTDLQKADIFTKGLARLPFSEKRKLLMGW